MLLSAAATMRTVLCSKLAYSEVTLHDLAGWIADHPTSSVSRRKMADITLETRAVPRVEYLRGHHPQEERGRLLVVA